MSDDLTPAVQTTSLMRPIASPTEMLAYHGQMTDLIRDALKDGVDFGLIPKTQKPTLYKAGAERLCLAFGCHPEYDIVEKEIDHDRENQWQTPYKSGVSHGLYRYVYSCRIVRNIDRVVIAAANGSCSTLEAKYISRPRDMENTVVKMAQKRAFVAAVLHAFGLSDRFTQDVEDLQIPKEDAKPKVVIFDAKSVGMMDKLEAKLIAKGIPDKDWIAIATGLHGKDTTTLDEVIKTHNDNKSKEDDNVIIQ